MPSFWPAQGGSDGDASDRLDLLEEINEVTFEPTGFENRTDSTISFDDSTRVFTIEPAVDAFTYWIDGAKFTKTAAETVTIADVTDVSYIYYDMDGILTQSSSFPDVRVVAIVSIIYWNASTSDYLFADERHGIQMDGATHGYLHLTRGAAYASGGEIEVEGTEGDEELADNRISISETIYFDEDIHHILEAIVAGTHNWEKWYIDASGNWLRWDTNVNDTNAQGSNATVPNFFVSGELGYNNVTTGNITAITGNDFVNVYIFGTNTAEASTRANQFIVLCGQTDHPNDNSAFAETVDSLAFGKLPSPELVPLYQITYRQQPAAASEIGCEIERILDLRSTRSPGVASASATTHNALSGLQGGTSGEYFHLTEDKHNQIVALTGDVVGTSDSQTLTNKTMDADNNSISNLEHGAEVDNPTSGVHGVTGDVVGTSDSQTLTNKTIDGDSNTLSNLEHGAEVDNPTSGVHGVTGDVVGTSDTQTLTNKTMDADNNTVSNLEHGSEVDNPSSGVHGVTGDVVGTSDTQTLTNKTLDGDDNNLWNLNRLNYFKHGDFENNSTTGWSVNDADTSVTVESTTPLRGTYSLNLVTETTADTSDYVQSPKFTIDLADRNKALAISYVFSADANYSAGDFELVVIADPDGTPSEILPSVTACPAGSGSFVVQFAATDEDEYALKWKVASAPSSQSTYTIDDVTVGPQIAPSTAAYEEWRTVTPSFSGFSASTVRGFDIKRSGSDMLIKFRLTAVTSNGSVLLTVPEGKTIGLQYESSDFVPLGFATIDGQDWAISAYKASSTTVGFFVTEILGTGTTTISNDVFAGELRIPIAEWSSNMQVVSSAVEWAYNTDTADANDTTSFGYGPSGALIPNRSVGTQVTKRVRFQNPIQPSDIIYVEYFDTSQGKWQIFDDAFPYMYQATNVYGTNWNQVNSTDIDVTFNTGGARANNATYGGNSSVQWSGLFTEGDKWRVRKSSAASSIGVDGTFVNGIKTDEISEYSSGNGVEIEGVLLKDGDVTSGDTSPIYTLNNSGNTADKAQIIFKEGATVLSTIRQYGSTAGGSPSLANVLWISAENGGSIRFGDIGTSTTPWVEMSSSAVEINKPLGVNGIIYTNSISGLANEASTGWFGHTSGSTIIYTYGPNSSTGGTFAIVQRSSDGAGVNRTCFNIAATGIVTIGPTGFSGAHKLNTNTESTAVAGAATLPSNPVGFIQIEINGTLRRIPYYADS